MKANRKVVFIVAYVVVALIAYIFFVNYSFSKYVEERTMKEAEWAALDRDPRWYEYFFTESVYYRNMIWVGIGLLFGEWIGAYVLIGGSELLKMRRKAKA